FYKRNLGGGELGELELVANKPRSGLRRDTQLLDLANDGHKYVVELGGDAPGYYARDGESWSQFVPFRSLPKLDWKSPFQRLIDLDGDGLADVLVTEDDVWSWYPSLGVEGFGPRRTVAPARDEERGPALVFSDPTQSIFVADVSGDGLADLVRVRNGEVCYWPNLGFGRFGAKVTMANAPVFDRPEQFDPRRLLFADVDGAGAIDLLYLGRGTVTYWNNEAGNGWSAGRVFDQLPEVDHLATVTAIDFLGNGTSCLVWSSVAPRDAGRPLAYLDLMGGQKPFLLASVRNNLGAETTVGYAPSTRFYVEDRSAGAPWVTRVPFPVQVVERFEKHDEVTGNRFVTTYSYHHGYYDGPEQEFRGFARVEQRDTEQYTDPELQVPPILTRTWYHTGAFLNGERVSTALAAEYWQGDPHAQAALLADPELPAGLTTPERVEACRALKGLVLRQEVYALDGTAAAERPYAVSEHGYELRLLQPRADQPYAVLTSHAREVINLHYERTVDPRVEHALTLVVDAYNNVLQSVAIAYPRRGVAPFPEQGQVLITLAESDVVNVVDQPDDYRIGVPLAKRSFQLVPPGPAPARYQLADIAPLLATRSLLARSFTLYYLDDLSGVGTYGEVGRRALPYRGYQQVLALDTIATLWGGRVTDAMLADDARYELRDGAWWLPSSRIEVDAARFYVPVRTIDAFGNTASVIYDAYSLLLRETHSSSDPALDNVVTVINDYRTLSPVLMTDPNGNRAAVRTDELGLVIASAVMGKADGLVEGDTLDDPTVRRAYDLTTIPVSVHTWEREHHGSANHRWLESYEYTDGFARMVQKKLQAEPDPQTHVARWVGSGRMVFNNKGKPVKQYEPFFSATPAYEDEAAIVATGVTPVLHYDPLGRVVRTDHADGSITRVELDAWQTTTYDRNDTVLESRWYVEHSAAAASAEDRRAAQLTTGHANTPAITHQDPLGRTFIQIADNGPEGTYHARSELDIQGRTIIARDHLDRAVMTFGYDMVGRKVYQHAMDAGERWTLADVGGELVRSWDSRDHARHIVRDLVHRPTHAYLSTGGGAPIVVERTIYGEAVTGARDANLIGKVFRHYDGAGAVTASGFDFKGNQVTGERRAARNFQTIVDWTALELLVDPVAVATAAEPALEPDKFSISKEYDALNRITQLVTPDGSTVSPGYNEARLLDSVAIRIGGGAPTIVVSDVDYDAKGQRRRIDYGSQVSTSYTYDRDTFRLTGLATRRTSDGARLQDLAYTYDPIGNVLAVTDAAQQVIYFDNAAVTPSAHYVYDAIYRLVHAEGREHLPAQVLDWDDAPRIQQADRGEGQKLQAYAQDFAYDGVGNLLSVIHSANQGSWNRPYHYATDSNQLQWTDDPTHAYVYDPHGNMTGMPHLASLGWNDRDQLAEVDLVGGGTAYYVYDAAGERARKVIVRQGGAIQERFYLGGYEVYRERDAGGIGLERHSLHVMDDKRRIALVETLVRNGGAEIATPNPLVRLQLSNLLGSAVLELELSGELISYEEYYPFGSTSYEAGPSASDVPRKRYRYVGKERDDETGLYYCGARYYAPWLGRWTAADPIGIGDGLNVYAYVANNPINKSDPTGTENVPSELYDRDVMNKTDPELYRYMKSLDEPTRALFVANTGGMF
ncbi:MAG: toxin TcdB middle/N-terminal domain-containing protein, partial [Kofleriaceae bacterium]